MTYSQVEDQGALIRSDTTNKVIYLIFTGDEYADGGEHILNVLGATNTKAHFFFTGRFFRNTRFHHIINQIVENNHYLGCHSDQHLLYADWTQRDSTLVSRQRFRDDVLDNYAELKKFGIERSEAPFFLPSFEWYNQDISDWTNELGFKLINMTYGTRSAADYTYPEMGDKYVASSLIYESIMSHEKSRQPGLNGFHLLLHIGTDPRRTDKFYFLLEQMITELKESGYRFELLNHENLK